MKNISFKSITDNRFILILLFLAFLHRLYYFNDFYVPNSDFFAFKWQATDLLDLRLPEEYARLPLFPLLIAAGSLIFFNDHNAILHSAELINLLLSIISLYLIFLISSRFLKKFALLVVFMAAINPTSLFLTSQPLLETLLLTMVLFSIYFDLNDDNKRYLFALLASMTRYEGFLLIPILVMKDLIFSKKKLQAVVMGFFSSLGMILWLILNNHSFMNPYIQATIKGKSAGLDFILTIANELVSFEQSIPDKGPLVIITLFVFFFLMLSGLYLFLKRSFSQFFTMIFFLMSYISLHLVYSYNVQRFVYPVLWIFFLMIFGGIEYLWDVIKEKKYFQDGDPDRYRKIILFGSLALIMAIAGLSLYETQHLMEYNRYNKAQFRYVGEWYSKNVRSGDVMLLTEPWIASYYSGMPEVKYFVSFADLTCSSPVCFIPELKKRKITYVVWDSTSSNISRSSAYYDYYRIQLMSNLGEGKYPEGLRLLEKIEVGPAKALIYGVVEQ